MVTSDREMVRKLGNEEKKEERSTSLQPTYEDSIPPEAEDWDLERE